MASFRKLANGNWLVEIRRKGQYKSKTNLKKKILEDWARVEEHKMGLSKGVLKGKTLGEAFEKYALEVSPKKKGCRWEQIRLAKLGRDPLAAIQLGDLCADDFNRPKTGWIDRQRAAGLQDSSIRREFNLISAVVNTARDKWEWLEGNPLVKVDRPADSKPRKKIISNDERDRILLALGYEEQNPLNTVRRRIGAAFLFAIETAMRYGEIFNMDWQDVNWLKQHIHLPETKNGEERDVSLSVKAFNLLQWLGPKEKGNVLAIPPRSAEAIFRRAVELAGYKEIITFHDTRHTAITTLAPILKDPLLLARMVGHKNLNQLMTYFNPTPESIADRLG